MADFPKRGEIWLVDWNPARGSEQRGWRPALVIQNDIGNEKASTTIVAAISGSVKPYPMNVVVEKGEGGLDRASIVKTGQILTIAKDRLQRRLGRLDRAKMAAVNRAIKLSLAV